MTAAEIIGQVRAAGGQIAADGADLVLTAPRPLPPDLLDQLKVHKHDILEEIATAGCTVTPIAGLPTPRAPVNLDEVLAAACDGVAGITRARFRALMSDADVQDIAAGDIPVETLHGYALSSAEGLRSGRIVAR